MAPWVLIWRPSGAASAAAGRAAKPAKKPTATVTVKKDNSVDVTVEGDVELKVHGGVTVEHRETVEVSPTAKKAADPVQVDVRESDEDCGAESEPEADEPVVLVTTPVVKKAVSGVVNQADLGEVSGEELMNKGLLITIKDVPGSAVITYKKK